MRSARKPQCIVHWGRWVYRKLSVHAVRREMGVRSSQVGALCVWRLRWLSPTSWQLCHSESHVEPLYWPLHHRILGTSTTSPLLPSYPYYIQHLISLYCHIPLLSGCWPVVTMSWKGFTKGVVRVSILHSRPVPQFRWLM